MDIGNFLLKAGYIFEPRPSQGDQFLTRAESIALKLETNTFTQFESGRYLGRGVAEVFDFSRGEQKIQLITAMQSPLVIILSYHSSTSS